MKSVANFGQNLIYHQDVVAWLSKKSIYCGRKVVAEAPRSSSDIGGYKSQHSTVVCAKQHFLQCAVQWDCFAIDYHCTSTKQLPTWTAFSSLYGMQSNEECTVGVLNGHLLFPFSNLLLGNWRGCNLDHSTLLPSALVKCFSCDNHDDWVWVHVA